MNLAPIILFVYNRPWHTQQTLEALAKNELANQSKLYIYADGAKENASETDLLKIKQVEGVVNSRLWCGQQVFIKRERNWGLADNIVDGVTTIVNKYGKIIVLEDDIVTSPGFLKYMNDALSIYENEEKVMHVSAYMFPIKKKLPSTFFFNTASCWGWGTWKRAWSNANFNASELFEKVIATKRVRQFNINNSYKYLEQLKWNADGKLKTWAVKWYATLFLNNGFALHPYPSLVNNIGHDGDGENCGQTNKFDWVKLTSEIQVNKIPIVENKKAVSEMSKFHKGGHHSIGLVKFWLLRFKIIIFKYLPERFKIRFSKTYYEQAIERKETDRIKQIPRFIHGTTSLLGDSIVFTDSASFLFIYDEIFKKQIYKFQAVTDSPYIIDAGANIGLSTIYFKQLYPNARIIAFEPDPIVHNALENNLASLRYTNVKAINKALWSTETELEFYNEGADGGRIGSLLDKKQIIKVKTDRLSNYITVKVDLLKIDIEGAEIQVLEECQEKLHLVNRLFIEYHSFSAKSQDLSILLAILEKAGFRYYITHIGIHSPYPLLKRNTYNDMDNQLNIYGYRAL